MIYFKSIMVYLCLSFMIFSMFTFRAQSALIEQSSTTWDTETNFEWLDLTATVNLSYDTVESGFSDSTKVQFGFRYATTDEVGELLRNAGFELTFGNNWLVASEQDAAFLLHELMGITAVGPTNNDGYFENFANGFTDKNSDTTPTDTAVASVRLSIHETSGNRFTAWGNPTGSSQFLNSAMPTVGSYLIRDKVITSVPEPQILSLFGFFAFWVIFRNKKLMIKFKTD